MALTSQAYDQSGNNDRADYSQVMWDAQLNTRFSGTTGPYFCGGTGAPTFSAPKGTVYTNVTGSSADTRMFINTDGGTTWTNVTTAG